MRGALSEDTTHPQKYHCVGRSLNLDDKIRLHFVCDACDMLAQQRRGMAGVRRVREGWGGHLEGAL